MSVTKAAVVAALSARLPSDIVNNLVAEYEHLKHQFMLRRFQPSELNAGRLGECVLRTFEFLDKGSYTPFGTTIRSSDAVINRMEHLTAQPDSIRLLVPRLVRVLLDVRNKRDVAHVGGEVNPNYSDSRFVLGASDWIMTELIRVFYGCSVDEARRLTAVINETRIPLVAEVDGFVRVQNAKMGAREKVLVILYYKYPSKVRDGELRTWVRYGHVTRFRDDILRALDTETLIHYEGGQCILLPRGINWVEKNIPLELVE